MSGVPSAADTVGDEPQTADTYHHHEKHHHHHHDHERPQRRRRVITWGTALFTFATFLLFLLVGLSLPIIKSVWLLSIHAKTNSTLPITSVATELKFGVWGFCAFRCVEVYS